MYTKCPLPRPVHSFNEVLSKFKPLRSFSGDKWCCDYLFWVLNAPTIFTARVYLVKFGDGFEKEEKTESPSTITDHLQQITERSCSYNQQPSLGMNKEEISERILANI
jgi:hypothetical protein